VGVNWQLATNPTAARGIGGEFPVYFEESHWLIIDRLTAPQGRGPGFLHQLLISRQFHSLRTPPIQCLFRNACCPWLLANLSFTSVSSAFGRSCKPPNVDSKSHRLCVAFPMATPTGRTKRPPNILPAYCCTAQWPIGGSQTGKLVSGA